MATIKTGNRVKQSFSTTGTGTISLGAAPAGYRTFISEMVTGSSVYYMLVDDPDAPTNYEVGIGTITSGSPDTLARDTVLDSSNGGAKVSWAAGTKTAIACLPSDAFPVGFPMPAVAVLTKTAGYTAVAADRGALIDFTTAGVTLTLTAAATLGDGWNVEVRNSASSLSITIDPNGAELIDGLATIVLPPGASCIVRCTGAAFKTLARPFISAPVLTKSGAYTAVLADRGALIDFTTAGVTLTLTAAATLGDGWNVEVRNSASSGNLTIDPNSTELIDGALTLVLKPLESAKIVCSGTLFRTVGFNIGAAQIAQLPLKTQTSGVATGTTVIPYDDTIPQITEGNEYLSRFINPKSTTSRLQIDISLMCEHSAAGVLTVALFLDSGANALAATSQNVANAQIQTIVLHHEMAAGSTSTLTFTVRAGSSAAGTLTVNGSAGARRLGGVAVSKITITEYWS